MNRMTKRILSIWAIACLGLFSAISAQDLTPLKLTLNVSAVTGDNLKGVQVTLRHVEYGLVYNQTLTEAGTCVFGNAYKGNNQLTIAAPGLAVYDETFELTADTEKTIVLQEPVETPYALALSVGHDPKTGEHSATLEWNRDTDYFFDDFESYEDFAVEFSPWTGIDKDKANAAMLQGNYPNRGIPQYATIFNPLTIEPSLWGEYPVLRPYSGNQYVGFIRTESGTANNDWLISPKISIGEKHVVRFKAKAGDAKDEQFRVWISTKGTAEGDFERLTAGNYEAVDYKSWKTIEYDLSAYANKDIYIAIQYVSKACFMLMVDDFFVGPARMDISKVRRSVRAAKAADVEERFAVYLDNDSIDEVYEPFYAFDNLSAGKHSFGVKSLYRVSSSELVSVEQEFGADAYADVQLNFKSNGGSPDGISVHYLERSGKEDYEDVIAENISHLPYLTCGDYIVSIESEDFKHVNLEVTVSKDTVINVALEENILAPFNVSVDLAPDAALQKTGVTVSWNRDLGWSDDFESYENFVQSFGDWTTVNRSDRPTYPISLGGVMINFPGVGTAMPCLIFNAKATTPTMIDDKAACAPQGDKCVAFFSVQASQSDAWLITPAQEIRSGYVLRFLAKAYTSMYRETYRIMASTTDTDPSSFVVLDELQAADMWQMIELDLSQFAGSTIYLAINYTTYDGFFSLFDSFYVGPAETTAAPTSRNATYEIYLNGSKVGETKECMFDLGMLDNGTYTVGVKAVYATGESEMIEYGFSCDYTGVEMLPTSKSVCYAVPEGIRFETNSTEPVSVELFTVSGVCVSKTSVVGSAVWQVPAGVYLVRETVGDTSSLHRIIVR